MVHFQNRITLYRNVSFWTQRFLETCKGRKVDPKMVFPQNLRTSFYTCKVSQGPYIMKLSETLSNSCLEVQHKRKINFPLRSVSCNTILASPFIFIWLLPTKLAFVMLFSSLNGMDNYVTVKSSRSYQKPCQNLF